VAAVRRGHHPCGEHAGADVLLGARHLQDLHPRVITVQDIGLGGLPDQFLLGRLEHLRRILDQVPLGRGGQGNAEVLLEGLQAVEGDAVAILAVGHHAGGRLVILLGADPRRRFGCVDLAAQVASGTLEFVDGGVDGRPPDEANQGAGVAFLEVDPPLQALRARTPVL